MRRYFGASVEEARGDRSSRAGCPPTLRRELEPRNRLEALSFNTRRPAIPGGGSRGSSSPGACVVELVGDDVCEAGWGHHAQPRGGRTRLRHWLCASSSSCASWGSTVLDRRLVKRADERAELLETEPVDFLEGGRYARLNRDLDWRSTSRMSFSARAPFLSAPSSAAPPRWRL
jgi:hypothetical protein